jgi:uncharacterized protein YjiS (DUF1127 family)
MRCEDAMNTMTTTVARHPDASAPPPIGLALHASAAALRAIAMRVDAWITARNKAADDRRQLAGMSERELLDIGLHPGAVSRNGEAGWDDGFPR